MQYDIVIVGSGLVGASLALALKNSGLKLAIVDKMPSVSAVSPATNTAENLSHARALALSASSVQCLETLGIWQAICPYAEPILEVQVSKEKAFGVSKISARAQNIPALGQVVNADYLNQILNANLNTVENITLKQPEIITAIQACQDNTAYKITLQSGTTLTTSLLVAADGTDSWVRKWAGIHVATHDYQQDAIVTNIQLARDHQGIAYERFTEEGSIAMLPFGSSTQVKCVLILPRTKTEALLALSDTNYRETIQSLLGYRLGKLLTLSKRMPYPLRQVTAETLYTEGVVLVGNAANTLNPIAAQGFNLGLRDAMTLAAVLTQAKENAQTLSSVAVLKEYAQQRRSDQAQIKQLTHTLATARINPQWGILLAEGLPFFKNWITHATL